MKKISYILWFIGNIILIYVCSLAIAQTYEKKQVINEVHESSSDYNFISPLLECNNDNEYYNPGPIRKTLENYIAKAVKSDNVSEVAYYVRLLNNGGTFGYNEKTKFIPASLVKLPLAISVMRQVHPTELEDLITITTSAKDIFEGDFYEDNIKLGETYSINTLLSEMLIHSDNNAATGLLDYLNREKTLQTYDNFGLGLVDFTTDNSLNISVKSYASFFRVLYNSSYLTREGSEKLLSLLSQSSFGIGIRAPLPANITIANKYGVRSLPSGEKHIHDCGIIYYIDNPYLLCVMTKGNNEKGQLQVISDISKMVYENISVR